MAKRTTSVKTKRKGNIEYIVIHCTAGSMNSTARDVELICLNRKDDKGNYWQRCGYHYIITKDGKVNQMLPDDCISNGVSNINNKCLNISYTGGVLCNPDGSVKNANVPRDTRTSAQKQSLFDLVKKLKNKYPNAKICGHKNFADKACPSFNVEAEFKNLYPDSIIADKAKLAGSNKKSHKTYKAHESEINKIPEIIDSVIRPVREILDMVYQVYEQARDTYEQAVELVKQIQKPIPIQAPDIKAIFKKQLEKKKKELRELVNLPEAIGTNVIIVPEDVEIPEGEGLPDFLNDIGGMAATIAGMVAVGGTIAGGIAGAGAGMAGAVGGAIGGVTGAVGGAIGGVTGAVGGAIGGVTDISTDITGTPTDTSTSTESSDSAMDEIKSQLPTEDSLNADSAVSAAIADAMANQPPTDVFKTDKEEIKILVEETAKSSANIVKYEEQLQQLYATTDDAELYIDLYTEARLAMLEIFPELKPGDSMNSNSVNPATLFALKITPALINYINSKVEKIEEKIMASVQTQVAAIKTSSIGSETNT